MGGGEKSNMADPLVLRMAQCKASLTAMRERPRRSARQRQRHSFSLHRFVS